MLREDVSLMISRLKLFLILVLVPVFLVDDFPDDLLIVFHAFLDEWARPMFVTVCVYRSFGYSFETVI